MSTPLVTAVIAVYNGAATVAASLESLLAQDYRPVEIVVVDDGSEDASAEVAAGFPSVHVIRQENRGPGAARNAGVAAGNGELVSFLDADDQALPGKLRLQVDFLLRHPHVGCVLGRQEVAFAGIDQPQWMERDPVFGDLTGICYTTAMIRRPAFESVGGFDPDRSLQGSEDRDLMIRLRAAGIGVEVLPDIVIRRNFTGANLTLQEPGSKLVASLKRKLDRERSENPGSGGGV